MISYGQEIISPITMPLGGIMYYGIPSGPPSGVLPSVRFSLTPISRDAIILYSVDWDFNETWHMTEHC